MVQQNRLQYISHKGKKILYINYSNLKATIPEQKQELIKTANALKEMAGSIQEKTLFLIDTSGTSVNKEIMKVLQDGADFIKSRNIIQKECVVGVEGIKKALMNMINFFSKTNLISFSTLDEAKEWLVT